LAADTADEIIDAELVEPATEPSTEIAVTETATETVVVAKTRKPRAKKPVEPKPPEPAPVLSTQDIAEFLDFEIIGFTDDEENSYQIETQVGEIPGQLYVRTCPYRDGELLADQLHEYVLFVRQLS
jgi:hypothetical protein